jgi:hypothetical protein
LCQEKSIDEHILLAIQNKLTQMGELLKAGKDEEVLLDTIAGDKQSWEERMAAMSVEKEIWDD